MQKIKHAASNNTFQPETRLRELHLENESRKKIALSKKQDMNNHMQMTEVREPERGRAWN
jgi:hypothetical protein